MKKRNSIYTFCDVGDGWLWSVNHMISAQTSRSDTSLQNDTNAGQLMIKRRSSDQMRWPVALTIQVVN
jgi:hypothetical protein